MTTQEFIKNELPLVLIVSTDIGSGKSIFDTYDYNDMSMWLEKLKTDFPTYIHTFYLNEKSIIQRRIELGAKI